MESSRPSWPQAQIDVGMGSFLTNRNPGSEFISENRIIFQDYDEIKRTIMQSDGILQQLPSRLVPTFFHYLFDWSSCIFIAFFQARSAGQIS